MRKLKLVLDFIKFSIPEKIAFFRKVIGMMTGNPLFPDPDFSLATATALVDQFEKDAIASKDGGKIATAIMHESEEKSVIAFRKLADYVNRATNGDEVAILSSGFHLSKERSPVRKVEFSITHDDRPGTVLLKHQVIDGAKAYVWQYCTGETPVTENSWVFAGASTKASYEISGLTVGEKYWFRVAAVTSAGTLPFCNPVLKLAE